MIENTTEYRGNSTFQRLPPEIADEIRKIKGVKIAEEMLSRHPDMDPEEVFRLVFNFGSNANLIRLAERVREMAKKKITKEEWRDYDAESGMLGREFAYYSKKCLEDAERDYDKSSRTIKRWKEVVVGRDKVIAFESDFEGMKRNFLDYTAFLACAVDTANHELVKLKEIIEELEQENGKMRVELAKAKGESENFVRVYEDMKKDKSQLQEELRDLSSDIEKMKLFMENLGQSSQTDATNTIVVKTNKKDEKNKESKGTEHILIDKQPKMTGRGSEKPTSQTLRAASPPIPIIPGGSSPKQKSQLEIESDVIKNTIADGLISQANYIRSEGEYGVLFCDKCDTEFSIRRELLAKAIYVFCDHCDARHTFDKKELESKDNIAIKSSIGLEDLDGDEFKGLDQLG